LDKNISTIFSKEIFASKFFFSALLGYMSSFFFFIRWRKEKERMKMEEMVAELSQCGSLVGVSH